MGKWDLFEIFFGFIQIAFLLDDLVGEINCMPETKGKENFIDTYNIPKKALFEAKILRDFPDSQFLVIALNWPRAWGGEGGWRDAREKLSS